MHNLLRSKLSNVFVKSRKLLYSGACHLIDSSMMFLRIKTCSIVPLPSLNPTWSHLKFASMTSLIRSMTTLPKTLLGRQSKKIPLELWHLVKSLFFFWYFNNHSLVPINWHLHILTCMLKQCTQVFCSKKLLSLNCQ